MTRFSASGYDPDGGELSYKWEFADGTVLGRGRHAHVHQAGHVHGEGDRDRRGGREVLQGGHGHGDGAGRPAPDRRARGRPHQRPRADGGQVHRPRAPTRTAIPRCSCTRGTSVTAASSFDPNPTHVYNAPGTFTARVTVTDGSGATASKTVTITVTAAPGNLAPVVRTAFAAQPARQPDGGRRSPPRLRTRTATQSRSSGTSTTARRRSPARRSTHIYTHAGHVQRQGDGVRRQGRHDDEDDHGDGLADGQRRCRRSTSWPTRSRAARRWWSASARRSSDPDGPDPLKLHVGVRRRWLLGRAEPGPHVPGGRRRTPRRSPSRTARGGKTTKSVTITVTSVAGAAPAAKAPDAAPAQASWFGVSEPVKTSVSGFAKSGLDGQGHGHRSDERLRPSCSCRARSPRPSA